MQRIFLKELAIENVPNRVCIKDFVTAVRIIDLDLDEIVLHTDFALKRDDNNGPRPARFDLPFSSPLELCPKVNYRIEWSIECSPSKDDDRTQLTKVNKVSKVNPKTDHDIPGFVAGVSSHFTHYSSFVLMDEEARLSDITFML
jgi:hypothetical protein